MTKSRRKRPWPEPSHTGGPEPEEMEENTMKKSLTVVRVFPFLIVVVALAIQYSIQDIPPDPTTNFLRWFDENGGWMPEQVTLSSLDGYSNGLVVTSNNPDFTIEEGQRFLIVPDRLQFSELKSARKLRAIKSAGWEEIWARIRRMDPLYRQDVVIALDLMFECEKGQDSFYAPYLDVLPDHVPRLDSFSEKELDVLEDKMLQDMALESGSMLRSLWEKTIAPNLDIGVKPSECMSRESFHRFVALVGSRAMILANNTKYLVPMADMLNHAPNPSSEASFVDHHIRDEDSGTITVTADRSFSNHEQIMEEYGKVDNSLFLTVFGFVPEDNPYHCVMMKFPSWKNDHQALRAFWEQTKPPLLDTTCVRKDGTMLEGALARKRIAMALMDDESGIAKCLAAASIDDEVCSVGDGVILNYFHERAEAEEAGIQSRGRGLEQDQERLKSLRSKHDKDEDGSRMEHIEVALRFSIEEKKVMRALRQQADG